MYMNGSPEVRYRIINETISRDDNLLNISYLCQIAGVFDCSHADAEFRRQILHSLKPSITERFQDFLPAFKSASHVPHLLSSFDGVIVESKGAR